MRNALTFQALLHAVCAATAAFFLFPVTVVSTAGASPPHGEPLPAHRPAAPIERPARASAGGIHGKVIETLDGGNYTYVHVERSAGGEGGGAVWAAGPRTAVAVGDVVTLPEGAGMKGFYSKTLDRTFDVVYFVSQIRVDGEATGNKAAAAHGRAGAQHPATIDFGGLTKAAGGQTVEELLTDPASFAGKTVTVRGKVTKFNPNIMGKNWIHIGDGTGTDGTNDLTVTSAANVEVGQTVLIKGVATADKDFGAGYKYSLIVEDAEVTVE